MKGLGWLCLWALALAAQAEVYTWKDGSGKTIFSDRPPTGGVVRQLDTRVAPPARVTGAASAPAAASAPLSGQALQQEAEQFNRKVEVFNRQVREENCRRARANVDVLSRSFSKTAQGLLQEAQQDVKTWCAS